MGQYYKGVIFTKSSRKQKNNKIKACLDNWAYNNGAKLMEHSYVGNSYVRAYEYLLAERYHGYPFVWVGDYADEHNGENIYDLAYNYREQQSDRMAKKQGFRKEYGYYYKYDRDGYCIDKKSSFYEDISCDEKVTYKYILNYDKTYSVKSIGSCTSENIVIPSEYEGAKVTAILDGAFKNCKTVKSIEVPNTVTKIGKGAFAGCIKLEK